MAVLDKCHNARNTGEYEGYFEVDKRLVEDLITACERVASALEAASPDATR